MMKHVFITTLLIFAVFANLRTTSPYLGEDLIIFTKFVNKEDRKVSDASLRLYVYSQNAKEDLVTAKKFNILKNSDTKITTFYGTNSLEPGEYVLRASANHKDFRRTRHAWFVYG